MKSEKKLAGKRCHTNREHRNEKQQNVQGAYAFVDKKADSSEKQNKHILKKKIVKILKKRGQVSFDDLIRKLDVEPSRLFKILAKLDRRGVVEQERREPHEAGKKCTSCTGENVKHHKRKRLGKLRRKMAHHGAHKENNGFKSEHGRHQSYAVREDCAGGRKHCTERKSHAKRQWQSAWSSRFALTAAA